jgi:hypothetical protein
VIVASPLDRERVANHTAVIRCNDGGDPPLSAQVTLRVTVSDVNDNSPEFSASDYVFSVQENMIVGTWVGQMKAHDLDDGDNAKLIYGMENNGDTFTIDTMLGDIYTTRDLDREKRPQYSFNVYAYDKSATPLTAVATVVVNVADKNDMDPVFLNRSYHFRVDERTPPGSFIGEVKAVDGDAGLNARIEYYMVTSQPRPRFPISVNSTGAVVVTGEVDYEAANAYSFVVAAVDMGSPPRNSTCHVTVEVVDSNDHSPVITFPSHDNPAVGISWDTAPGSEIAKVVAYDMDSGFNGQLSYSIIVANNSAAFFIDEVRGVISLGNEKLHEDVRAYNIVVIVRDNGVPQRAQQALLRVEVSSPELLHSDTNMHIVIALVCVTLVLALAVLTTLLLIRFFDRRRRTASEKHRHEILTKSGYQPSEASDKEPAGYRTATVFTSKREDTTVYSPKRDLASIQKAQELNSRGNGGVSGGGGGTLGKKKTVSFEHEELRYPSIMEEEGDYGNGHVTQHEMRKLGGGGGTVMVAEGDGYPVQAVGELQSPGNFSTFKPPPSARHQNVYEESRVSLERGLIINYLKQPLIVKYISFQLMYIYFVFTT